MSQVRAKGGRDVCSLDGCLAKKTRLEVKIEKNRIHFLNGAEVCYKKQHGPINLMLIGRPSFVTLAGHQRNQSVNLYIGSL